MNFAKKNSTRHRRFLRWLLIGVGLCFLPFVVRAIIVASYLLPDREAGLLRKQVMAATDGDWSTKVQFSLGQTTIDAVRFGLSFVRHENIPEARMALASIRKASVGVYERKTGLAADWSRKQFFTDTDQLMQNRGWVRLVGIVDRYDTVMVYVPQDPDDGDLMDACVAVISRKELVVVSTKLKASALEELIKHQIPTDFKSRLKLASYRDNIAQN